MKPLTMEKALKLRPGTKLLIIDSNYRTGEIAKYVGPYERNNTCIWVTLLNSGKRTFLFPYRFATPEPCDWWDIWMEGD